MLIAWIAAIGAGCTAAAGLLPRALKYNRRRCAEAQYRRACVRVWCADDVIRRLEEHHSVIDTKDSFMLLREAQAIRATEFETAQYLDARRKGLILPPKLCPPKFFEFLLCLGPRRYTLPAAGDLQEEYFDRRQRFGARAAGVWYAIQVMYIIWPRVRPSLLKLLLAACSLGLTLWKLIMAVHRQ